MQESTIAAIRFGLGLGPGQQPGTAAEILASLQTEDRVAQAYPTITYERAEELSRLHKETLDALKKREPGADDAHGEIKREINLLKPETLRTVFARAMDTEAPLRERLMYFWLDHFTASTQKQPTAPFGPAYMDGAIRANITGTFADMLKAVVVHPQMLYFLDQPSSIGPGSKIGKRQGRGLNENLAREVLELHTLGVGGAYTQTDVREFAKLLTGLFVRASDGFSYRHDFAEPGAETILGGTYGGAKKASLEEIFEFLDDLAVHPDTARHVAGKLVVHFVSDLPDPDLVNHVAEAWMDSGGDLMTVYAALLNHPGAWVATGLKARQPLDFLISGLRALGLSGEQVMTMDKKLWAPLIVSQLDVMGQPFMRAKGPDGWDEAAEAWINPLGLATRIRWSMTMPQKISKTLGIPLADPRSFVLTALGDAASPGLIWAVGASETESQALGLVFASPEFNRR